MGGRGRDRAWNARGLSSRGGDPSAGPPRAVPGRGHGDPAPPGLHRPRRSPACTRSPSGPDRAPSPSPRSSGAGWRPGTPATTRSSPSASSTRTAPSTSPPTFPAGRWPGRWRARCRSCGRKASIPRTWRRSRGARRAPTAPRWASVARLYRRFHTRRRRPLRGPRRAGPGGGGRGGPRAVAARREVVITGDLEPTGTEKAFLAALAAARPVRRLASTVPPGPARPLVRRLGGRATASPTWRLADTLLAPLAPPERPARARAAARRRCSSRRRATRSTTSPSS